MQCACKGRAQIIEGHRCAFGKFRVTTLPCQMHRRDDLSKCRENSAVESPDQRIAKMLLTKFKHVPQVAIDHILSET